MSDQQWMPIETAPVKSIYDSSGPDRILVWVDDGGHDGKGCVEFGYVTVNISGVKKAHAIGYGGSAPWEITHWMPLPEPPK